MDEHEQCYNNTSLYQNLQIAEDSHILGIFNSYYHDTALIQPRNEFIKFFRDKYFDLSGKPKNFPFIQEILQSFRMFKARFYHYIPYVDYMDISEKFFTTKAAFVFTLLESADQKTTKA